MQSFWNGLSALVASQQSLGLVASNIANQNTVGYGKVDASFSDLLTNHLSSNATAGTLPPRVTQGGWWGGDGVMLSQSEVNFTGIGLQATGNPNNLAIQGDAFFTIQGPNSSIQFTKAGNFQWTPVGTQWMLATTNGNAVLNTKGQPILVNHPGQVSFNQDGGIMENGQTISQLGLARVSLPSQSLTPADGTAYTLTNGGTYQILNTPATTGVSVQSGYLATTNVDLSQALADMVKYQNMYESNAKSVQIQKQMMDTAVQTHV